jgi:spore coat protein CotH
LISTHISRGPIILITGLLSLAIFSPTALAEKFRDTKIFSPDHLLDVRIELAAADWQALRSQTRRFGMSMDMTDKPFNYFRGDITIDGTKVGSVGIRRKGLFGSQDNVRPSLKISFDEFIKQDPAKGFDRLTLNNNKQDTSQLSQYLAYGLFNAAGIHSPRVNFALVTVNGEYLGIYSNVESMRRPFLRQRYGDDSGNLYEGTLADFYVKSIDRMEAKTNKGKNDRVRIERLAEIVSNGSDFSLAELEQLVDVDSFIRYWAIESLIGFWDGYAANQNNYFLYDNPADGKFRFSPWGADSTFTTRSPFGRFGGGNVASSVYAQGMIANRLFHTPGIPNRYRDTMRTILEELWDEDELLANVDCMEALLAGYEHPGQANVAQATNEIRSFIRGRRSVIERELEDENWPVDIAPEPRKPAYTVAVGTAVGNFKTNWTSSPPAADRDRSSLPGKKVALQVSVQGSVVDFTELRVFSAPAPELGGAFGGRNFGRGGQRPAELPKVDLPKVVPPATIVFAGQRTDGRPFRLTLTIQRNDFLAGKTVAVRGTLIEEERGRSGGFRGFGGRTVQGELKLTTAGFDVGDEVAGSVDLEILESRGGMFGGRGRGR